jgi:23S rRNA (adenine2503-C2)-methyltransferase
LTDAAPRLTELDRESARLVAVELGGRPFHGDELWRWITRRFTLAPERMTNLPAPLREGLARRFDPRPSRAVAIENDPGSTTEKTLLEVGPGETVECVLIMEDERTTACLSTQVGCPVACGFCASGLFGLKRNLTRGEILEQFVALAARAAELGRRVTHVVVMGMGEPMLNVGAVLEALATLNERDGIALGARHITVSTVGVKKGLERFIAERRQYTLAFSLHAPDDELRRRLIPFPAVMSIAEILDAARRYLENKGRETTFEYVLLEDVNASRREAEKLAALLRGVRGTVNLIPYNEVQETGFRRPSDATIDAFADVLRSRGVKTTVRKRKGHDIAAACGQLRLRRS